MPTTTVKMPPAPTWDLDSIFPGGSGSDEFKKFQDQIKAQLDDAEQRIANLPETLNDETQAKWREFILLWQDIVENIDLANSFAGCLASADVRDTRAQTKVDQAEGYKARWQKLKAKLEAMAQEQTDAAWQTLVESDELKPIRFQLDRMREAAKSKMPVEQESLALDLAVNGFHAWDHLYNKMAAELMRPFEENGDKKELSLGQLATKMSSPDRSVRRQAFEQMTEAWKSREDLAAMTLNSLVGFRLSLYEHRQWDNPMHEALFKARIEQKTLDTMWQVIKRERDKLKPYMDAKKKLMDTDRIAWYDQFAPVGSSEKLYPYDEAANFIVKNVGGFSKELADFCRMAIDKRWIEAEDRSGKRGGGFCTSMGPKRESRIFMTYAGSYENLLTLAHELGHAYHSWILKDKPFLATDYPMTLAETASIFSELLVTDAAMAETDDPREQLMLLDQKLQQSYTFFCDIHCRYIFDRMLHDERKNGTIETSRLCDMMVAAQKEAFGPLLDEYHPYFWASKLHFFISTTPFYNFPYTFGFLFAGGVYDRARKEGSAFADDYRALLYDTGSMTTEEVAKKHLDVDLTQEAFWNDAVARSVADVDEFVKLAEKA